jgi:hypothetical protein
MGFMVLTSLPLERAAEVEKSMRQCAQDENAGAIGYICGAQDEHQPAAMTSLPGKIWQGP